MNPWTAELQQERTALAWNRSWLATLGGSALVAREALLGGMAVALVIAAAAGVAWAVLATLVPMRYRARTRSLARGRPHDVMMPAVLAASGTVLLCLAALAVVLASLA